MAERVVLVDAAGNPLVTAPLGLDDTDKLKVSLYGKNSAAGDKEVAVSSGGDVIIRHDEKSGTVSDGESNTIKTAKTDTGARMDTLSRLLLFNGSTWDRQRNNEEVTLLASAARTANTYTPAQENFNARGIALFLDVTAIVDTPSITCRVYIRHSVDDSLGVLVSFSAVTAVGEYVYMIYPGASETIAEANLEVQAVPLPRDWQILMIHADSDSITYSLACSYIL